MKYTAETPLAPVGVLLTDFVLTGKPPLGVPPLLSSWLEVEMIRMRWLALALACAATTAVSAQETRDTTKGKIRTATTKAAKNTKKAVVTGAKDTKNAVVTGAKDTKKAVVTGAKDTKNAVVTGAKDTKNAVKKGASDTKTAAKKTTHAVKAAVKKDSTKKP
jgi:hypothetical protein